MLLALTSDRAAAQTLPAKQVLLVYSQEREMGMYTSTRSSKSI
jgi:hypothetical protein